MIELDARQIATLVWAAVIILTLALWPRTRHAGWPALKNVFRTMATWKIIAPILIYFIYAATAIFVTQKLNIWHEYPATESLIIVFFVGLPMLFNANSQKSGEDLFRKTLRETIGLSAIIVFYIGLTPLGFIGELILQPSIGLLSLLSLLAGRDIKNKPAKLLFDTILAMIGLWLMLRTVDIIASSWNTNDINSALDELILSIILPLLILPAIYIFALIMRYEVVFMAYKILNNNKKMRAPIRLACFLGMNIQLGPLNNLGGIWLQKLNDSSSFRGAMVVISTLKQSYREQKRKERNRRRRLQKMRDVKGADENGLQIDRREFYESKEDLENLLYAQVGQFRNNNRRYNPGLPIQLGLSKLPTEHGITMKVRKDRKAWYAWRQMPNSYYFGVGGSSAVDDMWFYDGTVVPSYPTSKSIGWHNKNTSSLSREWAHEDWPPRLNIPESYFE